MTTTTADPTTTQDYKVADLLQRIAQATPAEKAMVLLYERQTANREAVLHVVEP